MSLLYFVLVAWYLGHRNSGFISLRTTIETRLTDSGFLSHVAFTCSGEKPYQPLTHWGRVTHICVSELPFIGSDNGLSPGRRQAIIWTNDGILLIGSLGTNFSQILIKMYTFSFKKMHRKMSCGKWRPSCLGLNVLTCSYRIDPVQHSKYYGCWYPGSDVHNRTLQTCNFKVPMIIVCYEVSFGDGPNGHLIDHNLYYI